MSMKMTDSLYGNKARLNTERYLNTTGLCLEFFFWLERDPQKNQPIVNVLLVSEERVEVTIQSTAARGTIFTGWNKFQAELLGGLFQVVIEGIRSNNGPSGISIDDVLIRECSFFGVYLPVHC